jgi:hypothetical protein
LAEWEQQPRITTRNNAQQTTVLAWVYRAIEALLHIMIYW